jgi:RNA polymerase sigma-32 factor
MAARVPGRAGQVGPGSDGRKPSTAAGRGAAIRHQDGAGGVAPAGGADEPEVLWGEPTEDSADGGDLEELEELDAADTGADDDADEDEPRGPVFDLDTESESPASEARSEASLPALTGASLPTLRARGSSPGVLDTFLNQMGRYPLLTLEEERALTMRYWEHRDPVALRKLVVHNLRLVVKMAYKYRRAWVNVLDLIQEGNVGLVEAVQRFDPFKGAKFSTYATFWIRAYMLRYLLEHSRMVRISRTRVGRKLFFQLARERARLQAQGIEPGPKLLAERLGVDQHELEEVARHMDQAEVRLDAPLMGDDASGGTVLDAMASLDTASPEAEAYRKEFSEEVGAALESFAATLRDPREQAAWTKHLMAEDPMSLSELGTEFKVSKQRMGQIVNDIRRRLKDHLIESLGTEVQLGYSLDGD